MGNVQSSMENCKMENGGGDGGHRLMGSGIGYSSVVVSRSSIGSLEVTGICGLYVTGD